MKSDADKLLRKHARLYQLDSVKVTSRVQRERGDRFLDTLMLESYTVAFKYSRTKRYRSLEGALVNVAFYPDTDVVARLEFEYMKVVRIRRS